MNSSWHILSKDILEAGRFSRKSQYLGCFGQAGFISQVYHSPIRVTCIAEPPIAIPDCDDKQTIWSSNDMSNSTLPPLHTKLFGAFQVVDKSIGKTSSDSSHVDIAFGSDMSTFSGFHRFSVERVHRDEPESANTCDHNKDFVRITYASLACNPLQDRAKFAILGSFHKMYTRLLYAEAIAHLTEC